MDNIGLMNASAETIQKTEEKKGLSKGQKIAIGVGAVAGVALIGIGIYLYIKSNPAEAANLASNVINGGGNKITDSTSVAKIEITGTTATSYIRESGLAISGLDSTVTSEISLPKADVCSEITKAIKNPPDHSFPVSGGLVHLPEGQHASQKKIEEALSKGFILEEGFTFRDDCIRYGFLDLKDAV